MRSRNCNLELRLLPFTDSDRQHQHMEDESSSRSPGEEQKLTIFYNGRVCVCDATEFQARAILSLAAREMEETRKTPTSSSTVTSQMCTTPTNLSMKRSLQRFLQKRKNRVQSTAPYIVN